ncbi:MAG TPA: imidazole glycerol phosphate synthase subunit HisH [Bacteroidia bacterium]|nr:imidazole glycerol phosphate synthase subunit HisH [Bacteroidia bacterium]
MIVIVDYGVGNLRSVYNKLKRIGHPAEISSDPAVISKADKIILPGVGHFRNGMNKLKEYGLIELLNKRVLIEKIPIFGICLGVQLFTKKSEEGDCDGLGWIDAETVRFQITDKIKFKVPHIGWNSVSVLKDSILFKNVDPSELFYFVHSYHLKCNDKAIALGSSNYDYDFVSCIEQGNILGTQFHPEKSQDAGIQLFENFVKM